MSIEKVTMVNIVGKIKDINRFAKDIYLFKDIELLNAMNEIEAGRYTLPVEESNLNALLGFANVKQYNSKQFNQKGIDELVSKLKDYYGEKLQIDSKIIEGAELDTDIVMETAQSFIDELDNKSRQLNFNKKLLEETKTSLRAYSYLQNLDIPMRELNDLKNFSYSIGSLTNDNAARLKIIYPSTPSILFHIGDTPNNEQVFLVISANDFQTETDRVLKALDFKPVEGYDIMYQGTPDAIISMLKEKENALEREIEVLEAVNNGYLKKTYDEANLIFNQLVMLLTINTIKTYMSYSDTHFYFSAWIPERKIEKFKQLLGGFPEIIVLYEEPGKDITPPTKLHNNWLFRPFEQLVKMYGIPNYKELDPTPFLSITYILCFGYMFGDVGQGLVLLLGGLYAEKKGFELGGIAARIAVASIFFGFMYGSIFGIETILPTLWIKPMENTTTLLLTAVVLGVLMLIVSYIYSLINKSRAHDVEQEYFGKNGISGFLIYLLILSIVLMVYNYLPDNLIIRDIIIGIIVILTILVFLAVPMTNLIERKKFSQGIEGDYYVSSFFEVFEMYLSMLSNTLSFIRVGAFALTHVGMFMAFETIAEMTGGGLAGVIVLVIGNIFIIIMEGLIDCIQCLRLEFYELFGKYYEGNGVEFIPVEEAVKNSNPNI